WLPDARWRSVALDDVHIGLVRSLGNPSNRIILKIRLVDCTLRSGNLAASHNACSEHCGALELCAGSFRIYNQARVQSHINTRDPNLTLIINLNFNDRSYVRQETSVRCNPDASSLSVLALSPSGLFRDHLRNMTQTTGFPGIGIHRSSVIGVLDSLEIDRARVPDKIE